MSLGDTYKSASGWGMLNSFLNPQQGYEDADKQLDRSWQESKGYMRPFQEAGANAIPGLQQATGKLLDPAALENEWAQNYEMSPYAKDELMRSQNYGLDQASAMGLGGSSAALENSQRTGSSIMNADRSNYLKDLMEKYLAGVQSSQNIFGTGAGVGTAMGQGALQTGENRAKARYGAANAPGELFGQLAGTAAGIYSGMPSQGGGNSQRYNAWQPGGY